MLSYAVVIALKIAMDNACYHEMSIYTNPSSQMPLNPSHLRCSCSNGTGAYICSICSRKLEGEKYTARGAARDLSASNNHSTFQNNSITYKRASEYMNSNEYEYATVMTNPAISEIVLPPNMLDEADTQNVSGGSTYLCKKLDVMKTRMTFHEYAYYAMEATFEEVEKIVFLDIICLTFSFGILIVGFLLLDGCPVSPNIPVTAVCCGVMDSMANMISCLLIFRNRREGCWRDVVRVIRAIMFLAHAYGMILVYEVLHPEQWDNRSLNFCHSELYWLSFSYFHLFTFSSITTVLAMFIAASTYYVT